MEPINHRLSISELFDAFKTITGKYMIFLKITIHVNTRREAPVKASHMGNLISTPQPQRQAQGLSLLSFAAHSCIRIDNMLK